MRTVVDTREVPHLWAHQTQEYARNPQKNFFFENGCIFSYGLHFPIARHVTNKKGKKAILFTVLSRSNTTARHVSFARRAVPDDVPVFNVRRVPAYQSMDIDHNANWESYLGRMERTAELAKRARANRDVYLSRFAGLVREANAYAEFFGLGKKYRIDASKEAAELVAEFNANREKIEKAAKAKKAKEARERAKLLAVQIEQWKRGEINGTCYGIEQTFLRVEGEEIATSKGARFPLAHGIRAFKLIAACRNGQKPWERNGHSIHLGHYAIDRIDEQGNVKAGCHRIEWAEIERIAKAVGVTE